MPDNFGFLPTGLWGDEYRDAGGLTVQDLLAQQEADAARRQAAFDEAQVTGAQDQAAAVQRAQEAEWAQAAQEFTDWPAYLKLVAGQSPNVAYDDYVSSVLPYQLQRMGYSPEEVQRGVQQFAKAVQRPNADYGFVGNLWESLKGGAASGTRALRATGNIATGDVDSIARLVADQAADEPVAPRVQFEKGTQTDKDSIIQSIDAFLTSAIRNPAGAANFGLYQFAQSYPVMAAGLAGFLSPVPGGMAVGVGGGSAALDAGAEVLSRIATEASTRGVDVNDAAAVAQMLSDPAVYESLRNGALKHGVAVGAVDGLLAALSGGIGGLAAKSVKAGKAGQAAAIAGGGTALEAIGGGAGEYLGKVAAGDQIDTDDIVAEALGGLMTDVGPMALGAAREMRRAPMLRQPPPPVLEDAVSDFDEADLPGAFSGAPITPPPFNVLRGRPPPVVPVQEGGVDEITVPPIPGEVPGETPSAAIDVGIPGIEDITIRPPAEIIADAEGRILASRRLEFQPNPPLVAGPLVGTPEAMEQAQFEARNPEEFAQLDIRNPDNVNQWLADHGVVLESKEQMDAVANVLAAPGTQRQAAIADSIDGLAMSREAGAPALTDALLAMSRILPKDPVRKINIAQELGVTPEQVRPIISSALAQEVQAAIEGGVTDVTTKSATPSAAAIEADDDPLVKAPIVHARRGLTRGESLPATDLGSLARQLGGLGSTQASGGVEAPQVQPGGGVRPGRAQAGAKARGLTRGSSAPVAGSEGSNRVVADNPRGNRANAGLTKAAQRKARIDVVTMTKEEYESTYPGRKYEEDLDDLLDAGWTNVEPGNEGLNPAPMSPSAMRTIRMAPFNDVMSYLAAVMPTPLQRLVAQQVERLDLRLLTMRFAKLPGTERGRFRARNGQFEILIDPLKGTLQTVLHEAVHAATVYTMLHPATPKQKAAVRGIINLFDHVKENLPNSHYGLTNEFEFVAEAMSNPGFQAALRKIPLPEGTRYGLKNVWDLFKKLVMRLLGLNESDNALSEALLLSSDLFANHLAETPVELADKQRSSGAPSTALVGTKDGARTYIAYRKSKEDPDSSYTLYATTADQPRGDPATKVAGLTREQAEKIITDAGSEVIPPVADTRRTPGVPSNTTQRLVGYDGTDLRAVAFQQKDGTWTYYESAGDVRTDPDAKVYKGLSKDAAQRYITNKGLSSTPPQTGRVAPSATRETAVGYDPASGFRYTYQDNEATLKKIGEVQRDEGVPASRRLDIASTLRNSRFQTAWTKARAQYVEPARAAGARVATQYNKTQVDIEELLQNLHIAERMPNKIQQVLRGNMDAATQAAKIKALQQKQKAAESFVANVRNTNPGYLRQLQTELAPAVKRLSDNTVDLQAQYGLISRETAEAIKTAYDYYVPLQHGEKTTTGKAATGSNVMTDRSFARMVEQMQRTIARGEQNRVRLMVRNLARDQGLINNKTGESPIHIGPSVKVRYDPATNSLNEGVDNHVFDSNSIDVYEGGVRERLTVDDPSLLEALHPFKGEERTTAMTVLMGFLANVNRIIAIGKTSLNPAFPPFNFFRDVLTANINIPPGVSRLKFNMQMVNPENYAAVIANVAKEAVGVDASGMYQEAKDAGAFISHRALVNLDKIASDTDMLFRPGIMARAKQIRGHTFDVLSVVAQISESVPRYAMYKAALDSGMSKEEAAHAAKTSSVNFELHGNKNPSNYWIFGNAKVQGLAALANTFKTKGALSPTILGSTAGLVALGVLAATMGYELSDKDKDGTSKYAKIPNYKKDSLLLFKEGTYGVPIPQEIAPFYVMGNAIQEAKLAGGKTSDITNAASRVFTSFLNNLWPGNVPQQEVSGHKSHPMEFLMRAVLPSYTLPGVDIMTNRTTFGGDLVRGKEEKLKRGIPLRDMGSANENQLAVNVAKAAGDVGIDVAPQQIKAVHNYFDPATEGYAFWRDIFGGREPKYVGDIVNPFARKFTGAATEFYDQDRFDELLAKATQANYQATKNGIDSLTPEEQALARSAKTLAKVKSDVDSLFKGSGLMTKERRDMLNERKQELILNGIRRYNELRDRTVRK